MNIRPILMPYIPIAKMLVQTFGDDCEIVIHDLQDPEHSVVYVENEIVTDRKVGQGVNQLIRQVILSEHLKDDVVSNYYFHASNGKLIRSSAVLIREADGSLVGAFCINVDTSRITKQIDYLQSFLPPSYTMDNESGHAEIISTNTSQHVSQMITELIDNILANCDSRNLSREDKLRKIRFMDEKGVFLMKGSIDQVAEKLGVSNVTIYSYLDTIRGKR